MPVGTGAIDGAPYRDSSTYIPGNVGSGTLVSCASGRADPRHVASRQHVEGTVAADQHVDRGAREACEGIRSAVGQIEATDELADEVGKVVLVAVARGKGPARGIE